MSKGPVRKPRVSFFPQNKTRIAQMKITTKEPLYPTEEAPPHFKEISDYLQARQVFPREIHQWFPDGTHQLSLLVQLDIAYVEYVHVKVTRLNRKYQGGGKGRRLISEIVANDEPPIFNAPGFAPPLPSSF